MAPGQLRELHEASAEDLELQADRLAIKTGDWSSSAAIEFTAGKAELFAEGILVFKNARVVIPRVMRLGILKQHHSAHQGI